MGVDKPRFETEQSYFTFVWLVVTNKMVSIVGAILCVAGVSENIMLGQLAKAGTGCFDMVSWEGGIFKTINFKKTGGAL